MFRNCLFVLDTFSLEAVYYVIFRGFLVDYVKVMSPFVIDMTGTSERN